MNMSLFSVVVKKLRQLWHLARNLLAGHILRQPPPAAPYAPIIDAQQARDRARTAWFEQVRKRAPHLLTQARNYPRVSRPVIPRLRETSPSPADLPRPQSPLAPHATQIETSAPGIAKAAGWSRVPAHATPTVPKSSSFEEENEQELAPQRYQTSQQSLPLPELKPPLEIPGDRVSNAPAEQAHVPSNRLLTNPEGPSVNYLSAAPPCDPKR